jgi:hypothetical protein
MITLTSASDTPEQVKEALESRGYSTEIVEANQIPQAPEETDKKTPPETPVEDKEDKKSPAPAEPPADKPDEAAGKPADASGATDEKQEAGKPKPKKGIEERFSKLTLARKEAERETAKVTRQRDELELKLAELEAQTKPPADKPAESAPAKPAADAKPDAEPVLADFESYEQWTVKHQEWLTAQKLSPLQAEIKALQDKIKAKEDADAQHQAEQAAEEARKPLAERWKAGEAELKAVHADYDEVMEASEEAGLQASPAMHQEIFESEFGVKVNFYLATHPEECKRIFEATSVGEKPTAEEVGRVTRLAAREIGRIEALITQQPAPAKEPAAKSPAPVTPKPKPSAAPTPVETVGTRSVVPTGEEYRDDMTQAEFREWKARNGGRR